MKSTLAEARHRYVALLGSIDQGFSTIDVDFEADDRPRGYRLVEVSPSFPRQTGFEPGAGRWMPGIAADQDKAWLETCGRVALTGEAIRFEQPSTPLGCWWSVYAFRIEDRPRGQVGVLFNDITERKGREGYHALLLKLSDTLRPLADPQEIQAVAADLLGAHLHASQAHYAEVRGAHVYVSHSYADGVPPMIGTFRVEDFSRRLKEGYRAGELQVCADTTRDLFSAEEREALQGAHIGAFVAAPLLKEGAWMGTLVVHNITPRAWTPLEIELVQEVAERTWAAVQRAHAERALRASEEKYRTLFDSIDEGFLVVEVLFDDAGDAVDHRVLEVNPAHERLTGMPPSVVGKRGRELMPLLEDSMLESLGPVARTGVPTRFELYVSGMDRWFDIYLSRVGGEGSRTVACVFNNITDRKRRELHAGFLDTLSQALALLDSPEEIVRAAGERLGAHLDVGYLRVTDVDLGPDDDAAEARLAVVASWEREGIPAARGTYRMRDYLRDEFLRAARAGETVVVVDTETDPRVDAEAYRGAGIRAVVAVPIVKNDAWPGLIAVGTPARRDWRPDEVKLIVETSHRVFPRIERVRAEEARRTREQEVRRAQEIQDVNRELLAANEELARREREAKSLNDRLQELDRLKTQFFANVSHELRTPLALILGPLAKLLGSDAPADDLRRDLLVMERNARALHRHVDDLLDVAKLDAGKMGVDLADVDLGRLVRFTASHFDALARDRRITLTVDAPDVLETRLDLDKLERVVLNLLSNAFKYVPDGGSVRCGLSTSAGMAVLTVADSGPGVPVEQRETVFERFRRFEETTTRHLGGTGLGLAIARDFVKLHDGLIYIGAAPEGGALVTVELPIRAPSGVPAEPAEPASSAHSGLTVLATLDALRPAQSAAPAVPSPGRPTALVVEDHPDMRQFIAETLASDFSVVTASDGQEGLEKILALRPDVIVTDVMMPTLSGEQLVREIRARPELADVPIVLLTAKADDQIKVRLLRDGANDYVMKPFSPDELRVRVANQFVALENKMALLRSEERYRTVTESAHDAIVMADVHGTITSTNTSIERIFGYARDEMLGKPLSHLLPERLREVHQKQLPPYLSTGDVRANGDTVELVGMKKDGTEFPLELSLGTGTAAGEPFFAALLRDVTERKRAELARTILGSIVEASDDAIIAQTLDGIVLSWNKGAERLYGYSASEMIGKHIRTVFPPGHEDEGAAILERRKHDTHIHVYETLRQRKDGEIVHVALTISPMMDSAGLIIGAAVVARDITAQKLSERAIRELNAELEAFSYSVSHDLRAPLSSLAAFSDAVLEDAGDQLNPDGRQYVERVRALGQRMTQLIDDLLELSHVTRSELRATIVDLSALARLVTDELQTRWPARRVDTVIAPDLTTRGDPGLLRVAMGNLLENAWKFTSKRAEARVEVGARVVDGVPIYFVADNGVGFDMAYVGKLFSAFERLHSRSEFEGTGIGLATVLRIIHRHGGRTWAEGRVDVGATVFFTVGNNQEGDDGR